LVEHATENRSVGGSIPPLGTKAPSLLNFCKINHLRLMQARSGFAALRLAIQRLSSYALLRGFGQREILRSVSHHQGVAGMRGKLTKRSVDALKSVGHRSELPMV
jgi:hypothetical protein